MNGFLFPTPTFPPHGSEFDLIDTVQPSCPGEIQVRRHQPQQKARQKHTHIPLGKRRQSAADAVSAVLICRVGEGRATLAREC